MPQDSAHDSSPNASAVDAALVTAQQAARAAALAADHLDQAERSTKPVHARRWRIAGFSALQEAKVLATRAMEQLAGLVHDREEASTLALGAVLDELEAFAAREGSMTGNDAVRRAAAQLIAKFGGGR